MVMELARMGDIIPPFTRVDQILAKYGKDKSALIQVLLDIQKENHWLSEAILGEVSDKLMIPLNQVYYAATFYKAFSLVPQGRHHIFVCLGTACQIRGGPHLLDRVTQTLGIMPGRTSGDSRFSLKTVNCLGCCAVGPVMQIDSEYYSNPSAKELEKIVSAYK